MARPSKAGLNYFNLDIHNDDKLDLIEAEFGLLGFGIIVKLYRKIYENGYYYKWEDDEVLLFKKRVNVDINLINDVINACLRREIFNQPLYKKYKILTSGGIQRRYLKIVERRKFVDMNSLYLCNGVNDYINEINVNINWINDNGGTQSKVKESKVKESKHKYGEYNHVLLKNEELEKLKTKFTDWEYRIKNLDEYIETTDKKYKNHYLVILKWAEKENPVALKKKIYNWVCPKGCKEDKGFKTDMDDCLSYCDVCKEERIRT